jgi:chromosomal replication initiation ATPase DnaA
VQNPPKNKPIAEAEVSEHQLMQDVHRQMVLELEHAPSMVEADFIVSAGNQMAYEHICASGQWASPLSLITGPAKAGKSHLGQMWVQRSGAHVVDESELEALASGGWAGPILIEDVDRRAYDETALFHVLNQSMRDQRPVLMTARRQVSAWPYKTNDLLSRARLAAHFVVEMPDDTQLSQMFAKLFADRQVSVDAKIVSYLTSRMERSAEEVGLLVGLMDKLALIQHGPISRSIAAKALELRMAARDAADGE